MMLIEVTHVSQAALPVEQFKEHLRLGKGFADDATQDGLLETHLRAALAAIEARTGKILIAREFSWVLHQWRDPAGQVLPVSPVTDVASVVLIDRHGAERTVDPDSWFLEPDQHRPTVRPLGGDLPLVPQGGQVRVVMTAGYGPDWTDLPRDLAQAVIILAGHYYDNRFAAATAVAMPEMVRALIESYRHLRLFMGGAHG
ncbi:head-tail connector protein [Yoonia litorea]|uniref:Phage gp6-like head-tail connector protein n=1 Tax=Yoonia litorea TaxID=1123755 RepID=A0A1I6LX57_9RHOB|nr:head-tail connector protein [Yoonia litorea]SFS08010.1 phage conserved hypothetical protein, phiE125 gp8 family [Yoonia litorea]